jgi:hypothetical protein
VDWFWTGVLWGIFVGFGNEDFFGLDFGSTCEMFHKIMKYRSDS